MNNEKKIFLHVGLPKTATTFLQQKVFPNIKDVYYTGAAHEEVWDTPIKFLMNINDITVMKNLSGISEAKKQILGFLQNIPEDKILISNEVFSGKLGRYPKNFFSSITGFNNQFQNAKLLNEIFSSAKIILTIRKQDDFAQSLYDFHITKHVPYLLNHQFYDQEGTCTINQYFGLESYFIKKRKYMDINDIDLCKMAKVYFDLFGQNKVLVLPYEMLKNDLNEYLNKLYEFMNVEPYYPESNQYVNRKDDIEKLSYSPALTYYNNFMNDIPDNYLKRKIQKNDRGFKKLLGKLNSEFYIESQKLSKDQRKIILDYHKVSNQKLAEITGLDLAKYDYF